VRIIATTNRDLAAEAAAGTFRQDLYFRLSVIPMMIPPLRDRKEDIPVLAYRFAMRTAAEVGREFQGISPDAIQFLQSNDWPGNIRELQHAVERAVILSQEPMLTAASFEFQRFGLAPSLGSVASFQVGGPRPMPTLPLGSGGGPSVVLQTLNVADAEKVLIQQALEATDNNRTRAAELLGMSVRTLRNKLNAPADEDTEE
jgi:DNA-binding NtrC family response regulator